MRLALLAIVVLLCGCSEMSVRGYEGPPKPDTEVAIIRLWTPRTTNIFQSPGLIVELIDDKEAGANGRTSHAYILPGEHKLQIRLIQVKAYNLLCGALCEAIFNKPQIITATTRAGHTYTVRYINDQNGTVVLDDRGDRYDPVCLAARTYKNGTDC
jgi:hypothetical protein